MDYRSHGKQHPDRTYSTLEIKRNRGGFILYKGDMTYDLDCTFSDLRIRGKNDILVDISSPPTRCSKVNNLGRNSVILEGGF